MAVAGPNPAGGPHNSRSGAGGRERTLEEAELLAAPLLARANLLRMRGQWDEAVAVCTEALRRAPESATAHSLLGDIYEAQGKLDDALQWYGMAVDLAPNRPADREKLERVTQAQRARLRAADDARAQALTDHRQRMAGRLAAEPGIAPGASAGRAAAERTVAWFDRLFPPGRSESIARLIFAACGVLAALILSAALFVYATGPARDHGESSLIAGDSPSSGMLPPLSPPRAPIIVTVATPTSALAANDARPSPSIPAGTAGSVAATAQPAAASAETGTPASRAQRVGHTLAASGVVLTALRAGARGGAAPAQIDVAVPTVSGEAAAATQERVARAAALAARTLALADASASRIEVRVLLRLSGAAPTAATATAGMTPETSAAAMGAAVSDTPVFTGETTAQAIRASDPTLCPTQSLLERFTSTAWLPIPSATSAASTGISDAASPVGMSSTLNTPSPVPSSSAN